MNRFDSMAFGTVIISTIAGTTIGQTLDQGTIDRQRARLDSASMAPATNGWLNDATTPRFWATPLNAAVDDTFKHPNMQRNVYHMLWGSSLDQGAIDTNSLNQQAQIIADIIVNRHNSAYNDAIADGEYAIQILGLDRLDLHDHALDELDDSITLWNPKDVPANAVAEPWANFLGLANSPSRASPWYSNGVAIADAAIEYLTDEIVTRVEAQIPSFPTPIRLFFGEEPQRQTGANSLDNLGAIESVLTDNARRSTETLYGNYDLWDSTPATTVATEVFTSQPIADILADMAGWNTADLVYRPDNAHAPNNAYNSSNYIHQRPHFDHEFYPKYNHYNGILNTAYDGAIAAALDHPLNSPDWGSFKWSNNTVSGYF